jgi:hypothetical protein
MFVYVVTASASAISAAIRIATSPLASFNPVFGAFSVEGSSPTALAMLNSP